MEAPTSWLLLDAMHMRAFYAMAVEYKRWEDEPIPKTGNKRDCPLSDHQQAILDRVARAASDFGGYM